MERHGAFACPSTRVSKNWSCRISTPATTWLTRDVNDAEDVVQEACVRALKYIGSVRGDDGRAWFLTIVRRAFYDWCRRNRPTEMVADDGAAMEMAAADPALEPERVAVRGAESRLLADAVAQHRHVSRWRVR